MSRVPATALGRPLPARFRKVRLQDADRVLVDFVDWLEAGDSELATLVRGCEQIRPRLPSVALDRMLGRGLEAAGEPPAAEAPARRRGLWPALPAHVLGVRLPRRFRGLAVRFADPDGVLARLVEWLEAQGLAAPADGDARRTLVQACIDVRERLSHSPLEPELGALLERVGVTAFAADGERFDAGRHLVTATTPTTDPRRHDHVVETERLGYLDHGAVFQVAEVVVHRYEGPR